MFTIKTVSRDEKEDRGGHSCIEYTNFAQNKLPNIIRI